MIEKLKAWLTYNYGIDLGVWKGVVVFIGTLISIGLVLYWLGKVFIMPVQATEKPKWWFPEPPYLFLGLDYEKGSTFCNRNGRPSRGEAVSNGGISQKLFKGKRFSMDAKYTHHSCAWTEDRSSYDGFGVQLIYSPWGKK